GDWPTSCFQPPSLSGQRTHALSEMLRRESKVSFSSGDRDVSCFVNAWPSEPLAPAIHVFIHPSQIPRNRLVKARWANGGCRDKSSKFYGTSAKKDSRDRGMRVHRIALRRARATHLSPSRDSQRRRIDLCRAPSNRRVPRDLGARALP